MAEKKSFLLRIQNEMWKELEAWAQDEFRSVNGQIEFILREAILKRKGKSKSRTIKNVKKREAPGSR